MTGLYFLANGSLFSNWSDVNFFFLLFAKFFLFFGCQFADLRYVWLVSAMEKRILFLIILNLSCGHV